MKNYLAVDSGGTKILAVLYDEEFRPIKTVRVGSCRGNTTSDELVEYHLEQFGKKLGMGKDLVIDCVTGVADAVFMEYLTDHYTVLETDMTGELEGGLFAAGLFGDSLLALSGTGSQISGIYQGKIYVAGAYGAAISDLGSGYWIGRSAMEAAIADYEGYGERTLLTDLLARKYGGDRESFREAVFRVYECTEHSPVSHVASCADLVSEAARQGDFRAREILKETGKNLGLQMTALIEKNKFPANLPLTISGSVWRSEKILFDTFAECIRKQCPERPIIVPAFEPVIGFMIRHYRKVKGEFTREDRKKFEALYPQFRFSLGSGGMAAEGEW